MLPRVFVGLRVFVCVSVVAVVILGEEDISCRFVKDKRAYVNGVPCKCYNVNSTPLPDEREKPAPYPKIADILFEKVEGNVRALIQWVHRRSFLADIKDGFYLEVVDETGVHFSYNCDINGTNILGGNEIRFHFNECCSSLENGSGWKPGSRVVVIVLARPLYSNDDKAYYAMVSGKVPETTATSTEPIDKRRKRKKKRCKKKGKKCSRHGNKTPKPSLPTEGPKEVERLESSNNQMPLMIVLTCVCCLTCLLTFGIVFNLYIKLQQQNRPHKMDHRLLIIAENVDRFVPFVNRLVEVMKDNSLNGMKVTTNVRNSTDIARLGIAQWMTRNLRAADVVVFVVTEEEQLLKSLQSTESNEQKCSQVKIALNIAECLSLNMGFRASRKRFIVLDVYGSTNPNSFPFCTFYTLQKKFSKFIKHALDVVHCTNSTDDACRVLKQLSHCDENSDLGNETCHIIVGASEISNNLNSSILYFGVEGQGRSLLSPNIADDQLLSMESNVKQ